MTPLRRLYWPWFVFAVVAALATSAALLDPRSSLHNFSLILGPFVFAAFLLGWWVMTTKRQPGRWWPVFVFVACFISLFVTIYRGDPMKPAMYVAPFVALLWLIVLTVSVRMAFRTRLALSIAAIIVGFATAYMVRIDETDAEIVPEFRFAWQPTKKERFEADLAELQKRPKPAVSDTVTVTADDWAEFKGPRRDNVVSGTFNLSNPKQVWKQKVGAGWGSFSIAGDRAFTLEQRGNQEAVVCYHAGTGIEMWESRTPARFFEGIAGEGPRSTPTIHDGRVFAFGATGRLSCHDAVSGKRLWESDVVSDLGASIPQWGFASSPLVYEGKVYVFCAKPGEAVVAYDAANGKRVWAKGNGAHGYSSVQAFEFDGVKALLIVSDFGLEAFSADGTELGAFAWTHTGQNRVAQPLLIDKNSLLITKAVGSELGAKRLAVKAVDGKLQFTETWFSKSPKCYFNDGVCVDGHYYGFDDRNFVCVDLKNGRVKWNAGSGYGFGQVLHLKDTNQLLIQAENGKVVLLNAASDDVDEVTKFDALAGKTWNHPVICRGRLYVRNNQEAACYDIR